MAENTKEYLKEVCALRERLAPNLRHPDMDFDIAEEEVYIYEPLRHFDECEQEVMRLIIEERVRQIIAKGEGGACRLQPSAEVEEPLGPNLQEEIESLRLELLQRDTLAKRLREELA